MKSPTPKPARPSLARPRRVPRLRFHKGTRQYHATFKARGRRVTVYFGAHAEIAYRRYRRWAADWPAPLLEPAPAAASLAPRVLTFRGEARRLNEWARLVGLKPGTIRFRLAAGWTVELALTTPRQPPHFLARVRPNCTDRE